MKILHLSTLNPAIHTRVLYKLAISQREMGYQVSVAGLDKNEKIFSFLGIKIIPLPWMPRLSWQRWLRPLKLFAISWQENPSILCIHTPELLAWAVFYKFLRPRTKLHYDVHENYYANIRFGGYIPLWVGFFLAPLMRLHEIFWTRFFDAVSYAEYCYDNILQIPAHKKYILRNTFTPRPAQSAPSISTPPLPYLLYTGTIDLFRGLKETLAIWKKMNAEKPIHLVVAGFTHREQVLEEMQQIVAESGFSERFHLIGGSEYVAYSDILHLIKHCEAGTAFYHVEKENIREIIPTRIYEYMAHAKPLFFHPNSHWNKLNQTWNFGLALSGQESGTEIWQKLQAYTGGTFEPADYSWEADEEVLKQVYINLPK